MYAQYGFLHVILTRPKLTVHTRDLTWDLVRDSRDLRHLLSIPENMYCKMNKVSRKKKNAEGYSETCVNLPSSMLANDSPRKDYTLYSLQHSHFDSKM
jgi:hypothetical protein